MWKRSESKGVFNQMQDREKEELFFFLTMCYRGIIDCYLWEEGERLLGLIVRSSLCIDMAIWHYTFHMQERRSMICSNILYI
jgi:hypothetical protein